MKILRVKVLFEDGEAAVDCRVHDGQRERGVIRRASDLADRKLPRAITTYGELFAALGDAATLFAGEDITEEVAQAATEERRKATASAAIEAEKTKKNPKP